MKRREEEKFTSVSSYVTTSSERSWPRRGGLPLQASGVHLPFEDGWGDMIR